MRPPGGNGSAAHGVVRTGTRTTDNPEIEARLPGTEIACRPTAYLVPLTLSHLEAPLMESQTDIRIDAGGQWWTADSRICNESVLAYFKANLHRSIDNRYFIVNRFGELAEVAWLDRVDGFPLLASRCSLSRDGGRLCLDVEGKGAREVAAHELHTDGESALWVYVAPSATKAGMPPESPLPVRLSPSAMADLRDCLEETDHGGWQLAGAPLSSSPPPFCVSDG